MLDICAVKHIVKKMNRFRATIAHGKRCVLLSTAFLVGVSFQCGCSRKPEVEQKEFAAVYEDIERLNLQLLEAEERSRLAIKTAVAQVQSHGDEQVAVVRP